MRPRVLYPAPLRHTELAFAPAVLARLGERFDVTLNGTPEPWDAARIASLIDGCEVLVTGYGMPELTDAVFEHGRALRVIVHAAGSPRGFLSDELVRRHMRPRGIRLATAREALASNVAEATLGLVITVRRRLTDAILAIRANAPWRDMKVTFDVPTLNGSTVGIVGASSVGRALIRLLRPFDTAILLHDPLLAAADAAALGVTPVGLEELFEASDVVSIHAPSLPATRHLVNADRLGRMREGAILVNTARGALVDHDALLAVCNAGRIIAVLDVTDPEPLPVRHPLRALANVFITPHVTGPGRYGYRMMGEMALGALDDFFAGRPMRGEIDVNCYDTIG